MNEKKIDIFPNPVSNIINIMSAPGEIIKIIDLNGKIVKSISVVEEKSVINISDLDIGIYIVKSGNKASKFIKN